jgi:hypothetical protein
MRIVLRAALAGLLLIVWVQTLSSMRIPGKADFYVRATMLATAVFLVCVLTWSILDAYRRGTGAGFSTWLGSSFLAGGLVGLWAAYNDGTQGLTVVVDMLVAIGVFGVVVAVPALVGSLLGGMFRPRVLH